MSRVDETEFVALTGCTLSSSDIIAILNAADKDVNTVLQELNNPALPEETLCQAAMLYAKALLADRKRFDGTFDASTTDYSHKGNTEAMIASFRAEARGKLQSEALKHITWIQKANR
jgi:hypothetical protein